MILWTRVTPGRRRRRSTVTWEIAADPSFDAAGRDRARRTTSAERDFTVKVDARGLAAGRTYYYRFRAPAADLAHRPHAHRADRGRRARALRRRLLLELRPGLLPRLPRARRARRPRRRDPPRRLHLRVGPRPVRRRPRHRAAARDRSRSPTTAPATPSTSATPTCRRCTASTRSSRLGRPRDGQQRLEGRRRRTTSPPPRGAGPTARPPPSGPTPSGCRSATRPTRPHLAQARLGRPGRPHPARHAPVGPHRQQRGARSGRRRADDPGAHPAGRRPGRLARGAAPRPRPRAGSWSGSR